MDNENTQEAAAPQGNRAAPDDEGWGWQTEHLANEIRDIIWEYAIIMAASTVIVVEGVKPMCPTVANIQCRHRGVDPRSTVVQIPIQNRATFARSTEAIRHIRAIDKRSKELSSAVLNMKLDFEFIGENGLAISKSERIWFSSDLATFVLSPVEWASQVIHLMTPCPRFMSLAAAIQHLEFPLEDLVPAQLEHFDNYLCHCGDDSDWRRENYNPRPTVEYLNLDQVHPEPYHIPCTGRRGCRRDPLPFFLNDCFPHLRTLTVSVKHLVPQASADVWMGFQRRRAAEIGVSTARFIAETRFGRHAMAIGEIYPFGPFMEGGGSSYHHPLLEAVRNETRQDFPRYHTLKKDVELLIRDWLVYLPGSDERPTEEDLRGE